MEMIKQAGAVESIINSAKEMVDFKNKPFETIFGIMGTGYSWKFGWIIGSITTIAEVLGYGPGYIGKLIDRALGFGSNNTIDNIGNTNIESAARSVSNEIMSDFSKESDRIEDIIKPAFISNLRIIKQAKGTITQNDLRSAYLISVPITKTANIAKLRRFRQMFSRGGAKNTITSILVNFLKIFFKGFAAIGIGSGIAGAAGIKTQYDNKEVGRITEKKLQPTRPANLTHYKNVENDVKSTLIRFLDASIANFSVGFEKAQKGTPISLERASGWNKVLDIIEKYNWANLYEINQFETFVGPNINSIAKILLGSVGATNVKIEKIEQMNEPKKLTDEERLKQLI